MRPKQSRKMASRLVERRDDDCSAKLLPTGVHLRLTTAIYIRSVAGELAHQAKNAGMHNVADLLVRAQIETHLWTRADSAED
jgi:hypothetical protein